MEDTIILINEAKCVRTLPAVLVPRGVELTPDQARDAFTGLNGQARRAEPDGKVTAPPGNRLRLPTLHPGERVEIPGWAFDALLKIRSLKKLFKAKKDGISVGRTRTEAAAEARQAREVELERTRREAQDRAEAADRRAQSATEAAKKLEVELEREMAERQKAERSTAEEIARLQQLLAKRGLAPDAKPDDAKADKAKNEEPDPKGRASRNG